MSTQQRGCRAASLWVQLGRDTALGEHRSGERRQYLEAGGGDMHSGVNAPRATGLCRWERLRCKVLSSILKSESKSVSCSVVSDSL